MTPRASSLLGLLALASCALALDGYAFYVPTGGWSEANPPSGATPPGAVRLSGVYPAIEACAAAVVSGPGSAEFSYSAGACFAYVNGSSQARVDGLFGCTVEDAASFSIYRDAGYDGTNRTRPANCPGGTNMQGGYYIPVLRTCGAGRKPCAGACAAVNAAGCCSGEYYRLSPPACVASCPADSGVSIAQGGVLSCAVCPQMSAAKGCCVNALGCCVSGPDLEYYDGFSCRRMPCPEGWILSRGGVAVDELRCSAPQGASPSPTPTPTPVASGSARRAAPIATAAAALASTAFYAAFLYF